MSLNIDIQERMIAAYGFLPSGTPRREAVRLGIAEAEAEAQLLAASGKSVGWRNSIGGNIFVHDHCFADLTLRSSADGTTYQFRNGILTDAVDGILAPPPMLTFERKKNIVTTKVDGSDAVVVESFGAEPWKITITGILVDLENHDYPSDHLREFAKMVEVNTTYEVWDCDILADLGIEQLYFEKIDELKVLEEYQDTVSYKLTAHSIKPVEFFI